MLSTLRARITATCVSIVVVALSCSALVSYTLTRHEDEATLRQTLLATAQNNRKALDEWVGARASMVGAVSEEGLSAQTLIAVKQLEESGGFVVSYVGFTDKRAVFSRDLGIPADYDPTSRPWYQAAAQAGNLIVTAPYPDVATKKLVVTFARPVLAGSQLKAVVAADVSLDGVDDIVKGIHPSPASFAFIVDPDGRIIAHPDGNLSLKPATELSSELSASVLGGMTVGSAPLEVDVRGRHMLLQAEPVSHTNWKLVVALDETEALQGLNSILLGTAVTLLVLSLAAVGVITWVTSSGFRRLSEVRAAMEDIGSGDGDLSKRLPVDGKDEVAQIGTAYNRFADKMVGVLRDISATTDSVRTAAAEISQGNRDLSARTEQAAASLEETAASMEEIMGTVKNSADSAARAGEMALSASRVANEGGAVVSDVVSTMGEIAASSTRIRDIISVIDGIAFQTNILALNAAVEAARAGEQGRGFAVVAGEVRSLAQRSAQAAKEISELIKSSVERVDAGSQLVQRAGTTMTDIVSNVGRVSDILQEISAATTEQSRGIAQVNQAVTQLDGATQQNAALVEEAAAASHTLHDQSVRLAQAVGQFKL